MPENENPSAISHVSIGTNHFAEATAFYDSVLAILGIRRIVDFPDAVAYGKAFPEFWVQPPHDGKAASAGNGTHFSFLAEGIEAVDRFYSAAIRAGALPEGEPGPRPQYTDAYYGCFVRDLDGHKIEAMYWDQSKAQDA